MPAILVFPSSTISTGTALDYYRAQIERKLGPFFRGQVSARVNGFESDRFVPCLTYRTDQAPSTQFDNLYLYVRTGDQAGEQRAVMNGRYDGPNGGVYVDYPFDDDLEEGSQIEIAVAPATDYLGFVGVNTHINSSLAGLWLRDRLTFDGSGDYSYSLHDYPWFQGLNQVVGVVDTLGVPVGGNPALAMTPWRIRYNGDTRYLETDLAYATGTTFQVEVYRPANTLIKTGGVWGSGDGLLLESDEAVPPPYLVVTLAMALTYQHLLGRAEWDDRLKPSRDRFEREYRRWGQAAVRQKWEDLPYESAPLPIVSGGTRYVGDKGLFSSW